MMKKYTHKELQDRLPDYVFDRLDSAEREIFDNSISDYPDLVEEIKETGSLFSEINKINLDKALEQKTRNLSVKVLNRVNRRSYRKFNLSLALRLAMPVGIIVVFIFVYFSTIDNYSVDSPKIASISSYPDVMFKPGEALTIFDSTVEENDIYMLTASLTTEYEISYAGIDESSQDISNSLDQILSDFISESIFNNNKSDNNQILWQSDNGLSQDDFDLINEEEFQNLLEAIENANFNS